MPPDFARCAYLVPLASVLHCVRTLHVLGPPAKHNAVPTHTHTHTHAHTSSRLFSLELRQHQDALLAVEVGNNASIMLNEAAVGIVPSNLPSNRQDSLRRDIRVRRCWFPARSSVSGRTHRARALHFVQPSVTPEGSADPSGTLLRERIMDGFNLGQAEYPHNHGTVARRTHDPHIQRSVARRTSRSRHDSSP